MSTPSIKVGQGNWGIKAGNLLAYANTEKKFAPIEFTSSRALNTATRVNPSGNIEIVNANIPRIDYFGGQASLLVEPSAKNFWLQSENLSSASWSKLAGGSGIAPTVSASTESLFGLPTFEVTFTPNGTLSGDTSTIRQGFTPDATGNHTQSWYIRSLSGTQQLQAFFAGGVFQLTITETPTRITATSNLTSIIVWNSGLTQTGTHTRTNGKFLITAAQMEAGSVATSYIPTTTGSVTRNADVISVTGVAGLIGQTEGTLYIEVQADLLDDDIIFINRLTGAGSNSVNIVKNSSNQVRGRITYNNTHISFTTSAAVTGMAKIAIAYKSGDSSMYVNGIFAGTSATAFAFTAALDSMVINKSAAALFGVRPNSIRAASIYQTRLPNTTTDGSPSLQSITTL